MEKHLLKKLSETTEEEKRILAGLAFESELYFEKTGLIKSEKILPSAKEEIGIKTHTRFAAFPEHAHTFVEMMIVLSGNLTHIIGERVVRLNSGDILIMNKHIRHSVESAQRGDIGVNVIMTDAFVNALSLELAGTVFEGFLKDNSKSDGIGSFLHFSTGGKKQAENLIENIIFELTEKRPDNAIISRTLALLFSYLSGKSEMLTFANVPVSTESARKSAIKAYIRNNYRTAKLPELGEILFLSVPYLSKLITEYFGKSFKELLLEERLLRADLLVTDTTMSVSEIIRNVGYENVSYFHREYKAKFGTTPLLRRKASNSEKLHTGAH